ncbi:MAG TPA: ATP-dependent protease ATPase subunit HslU [Nitrolancea sp.]|nr:ATP-dependent protease ATPase subunit HslU [Nitrolancea sp.]
MKSNAQSDRDHLFPKLGEIEKDLTPRRIVDELDRYIIGQHDAKRAVAVAIRNRWRRQQLDSDTQREILPKNILMIGPTGVGKTEIARRVARIVDAPFIKVEATKYTEAGYVGRDVESIIRELVDNGVNMLHLKHLDAVRGDANEAAIQRLADMLVEQEKLNSTPLPSTDAPEVDVPAKRKSDAATKRRLVRRRKQMIDLLARDALDDEMVEIDLETDFEATFAPAEGHAQVTIEEAQESLNDFFEDLIAHKRSRRVSVREARRILTEQEAHRLVDYDSVIDNAIKQAEESGIVFIDELDKTINPGGEYGPDVSGEGVQRDLLPIVEGSIVMTRYGPVRTDHILFIAAGAFHSVRPSDLIPELQGRFPIRVELNSLSEEDLNAILREPENALTKQYQQLLQADGVSIEFTDDGIHEIARMAAEVNERTEDIGARRLYTLVERVLEDASFDAPELAGDRIVIDADYVRERVEEIAADDDISNFIL